jgi:hypothetical protein
MTCTYFCTSILIYVCVLLSSPIYNETAIYIENNEVQLKTSPRSNGLEETTVQKSFHMRDACTYDLSY